MPNIRAILAAFALGLCFTAAAAAPAPAARYSIKHWGPDEGGLPSSSVISLIQTRDGYLWLGTFNGLFRFDGVQFTRFSPGGAPELDRSPIVQLFEDSQRNLWVGTDAEGTALVKDGRVIPLDIGQRSWEGRLVAVGEDAEGGVWLYTANGELGRHLQGKVSVRGFGRDAAGRQAIIAQKAGPLWVCSGSQLFSLAASPNTTPGSLTTNQVLNLNEPVDFAFVSERGGYWVLAGGHIEKWGEKGLIQKLGSYPWGDTTHINAACEDARGNLVVGTGGEGVFWFEADGAHQQISQAQGLSHNTVLSLCADREGNLWVGTDGGGLNRLKREAFDVLEGSRGRTVRSVSQDEDGGLWFGTFGEGVKLWKDGQTRQIGVEQGLTNLYVRNLIVNHARQTWVAVDVGKGANQLLQVVNGQFESIPGLTLVPGRVSGFFEDHNHRLWMAMQAGLACWDEAGASWQSLLTTTNGLSANDVRALAEDHDGNLWVGTRGGGLNRLRDGKFEVFHKQDPDGLPSEDISSLYVDADGVLWIGTPDKGLARFHQGKWTRYSTRDGLADNSIGYLIDDAQGNLWAGSNLGLMRLPKAALNAFALGATNLIPCRVYEVSDGLPTSECSLDSQPGPCRTKDGRLWFPTTKGLAFVDPAQLRPNTNPPPVAIESVLIERREQGTNGLRGRLPASVTMHPGQEQLEIHYTSLNLSAPERARFKYRLEGHETAWRDAGNVRPGVAWYSQLPPKTYRFQVMAGNEDGVWNDTGATLEIIVLPPFWQTWWFITGGTLVLLGMIVGVVHYYSTQRLQRQLEGLRQQQALEKERQRIARDIHDQLGASLTQVAMLGEMVESDKDLPAEVEDHARQICQTARDTSRALDQIVWAVNPSNDTLDSLITYFCKNAQEYLEVAGLPCRLEVPAQLPAIPVPPEVRHNAFLAAKEAVTNTVRHAKPTCVWIRLRLEPGRFVLEVEDNGRGMAGLDEKKARLRNGLSNMRKRMEEIGGSCTFSPGAEGGTLVRLIVPLGKG